MREFLLYGTDGLKKKQALFASFFVVQNRLQVSGENIQEKISMRQWHLLAMTEICDKPKTLTNIGKLMGCSRQNVKNLAAALEEKGFIIFEYGANNSVLINITECAYDYLSQIGGRQTEILNRLFSHFTEREIDNYFYLQNKLLDGLSETEKLAREIKKSGSGGK